MMNDEKITVADTQSSLYAEITVMSPDGMSNQIGCLEERHTGSVKGQQISVLVALPISTQFKAGEANDPTSGSNLTRNGM